MDHASLIADWAAALRGGKAGVFVGAGLSQAAGYPDWRSLLRDIATELGLDIAGEPDLAAVAQYYLNRGGTARRCLTERICAQFPRRPPPAAFRILARLPLATLWTTNYDCLIEDAFAAEGRRLHVAARPADLITAGEDGAPVLHKMHGTVCDPAGIVIAKDDFELYRRDRGAFLSALAGDVVSRRLLFLGFGFGDPNLTHLFASIRQSMGSQELRHATLVRPPDGNQARYRLWMEDLRRYGIQAVELAEWSELERVLEALHAAVRSAAPQT